MYKDQKFCGERLKEARLYRGMSTQDIADGLSVQRQTINLYEKNAIQKPDYELIKKMSGVLSFPVKFFLTAEPEDEKSQAVYFRSLLTTNKKYRQQQIQKMQFISIVYKLLDEYIEFPELNLPTHGEESPEEMAVLLRQYWGLGDKPIENIVYLAEKNGVFVSTFESGTSDIDAFSKKLEEKKRYIVAYSRNKGTAARIHFDIAHELGHILLHDWYEDVESLSKDEFKKIENEAHTFASAFLLPKETFSYDVGRYGNNLHYYLELKKKWKVSISMMIRRTYNLGLIDYATYQALNRRMQKEGIKKYEPLDDVLITAKPSLLKTSIEMLVNDNVLTAKEFMDELESNFNLSIHSEEVEKLFELKKDFLKVDNVIPFHTLKKKQKI